jgi:protein TonB
VAAAPVVAAAAAAAVAPARTKQSKAAAKQERRAQRALEQQAALASQSAAVQASSVVPIDVIPSKSKPEAGSATEQKTVPPGGADSFVMERMRFDRSGAEAQEDGAARSGIAGLRAKVEEVVRGKWQMLVGLVVVLLIVTLGTILWRSHKGNSGTTQVKAAERAEPAPSATDTKISNPAVGSATAATPPTILKAEADKQAKLKDQSTTVKPPEPDPTAIATQTQASLLGNGELRTPTAMPKTVAKKEDALGEGPGGGLPGVLSGVGTPNSMMNVVRDMPVAQPKIAPQKVKVSSGVAQGLLVHQVTPQYPSQARQQGIQGTVVVQAVIAKDGTVHNVKAVSGSSMLRQAAVDAVKQWKYRPYSLDGEPVEADTEISIKFNPN